MTGHGSKPEPSRRVWAPWQTGCRRVVGSSDPAAAPEEMGTIKMPPRPFLAPVAAGMGEEVAQSVGAAVAAALQGQTPDEPSLTQPVNWAPTAPMTIPLPPVFVPGTPDNNDFVDSTIAIGRSITTFAKRVFGPERPSVVTAAPPQDAKNPEGAKAPGKPTDEDGFQDPKGGENWVPNPNGKGYGWEDSNGDVWVPTGPGNRAHGGPHWDVQSQAGGYRNVYPGGSRRPGS